MAITFRKESPILRIALAITGIFLIFQLLRISHNQTAAFLPEIPTQIVVNPKWSAPPPAPAKPHPVDEPATIAPAIEPTKEAHSTTTERPESTQSSSAKPTPTPEPKKPSFPEQFPNRLWQTSQKGFSKLNEEDRGLLQTWLDLNPSWRYESITQDTAEGYVKDAYADEPKIISLFQSLSDPILRADFIRYLVLLKDGGIYSDSDTKALKPIDKWIPAEFHGKANVVVGVEYDVLNDIRWADWTMDLQFTTWTIMSKAGHPLFRQTVDKVANGLKDLAKEQSTTTSDLTMTFSQVLDTTGPAMFSRTVFAYLSQNGVDFTWKNVTGLKEPMLVEDVLILPITAFGCGQDHSGAGKPDDPGAFVQHMFHGSWKNKHSLQDELKMKEAEQQRKEQEREEEARRKQQDEAAKNKHS